MTGSGMAMVVGTPRDGGGGRPFAAGGFSLGGETAALRGSARCAGGEGGSVFVAKTSISGVNSSRAALRGLDKFLLRLRRLDEPHLRGDVSP